MEDYSKPDHDPPPPLPIPEPPTEPPQTDSWLIKIKHAPKKHRRHKKKRKKYKRYKKKSKKNKKIIIKIAGNKNQDPNPDPLTEILTNGVLFH